LLFWLPKSVVGQVEQSDFHFGRHRSEFRSSLDFEVGIECIQTIMEVLGINYILDWYILTTFYC
jgi:hypothetical protein